MPVLDDADPEPEFHRHPRLALAEPLGVGLEDGEDFFMMRDGFVEVRPADDWAHEFFCRAHALPQARQFQGGVHPFFQKFQARLGPQVIRLGHDDVFEMFLALRGHALFAELSKLRA